MNKLTDSIFRILYQENLGKNFCFSPASYLEAINSLSLCIKGSNLKEVLEKLEIQESDLFKYIKSYKQNLNLETYNALLYSQEFWAALNPEVINNLKEFGADIESLDFADVTSVVNRVNGLTLERTHGKINDLISAQDINEFTKFIILNCVYFKKDWLYEFDEKHYEDSFFGINGEQKVKFLYETKYFHFYEDSDLDIVEIPYKDSDICCYLLVPTKNKTVFDIIGNLRENYDKINNIKYDCQVSLTVPRFEVESTFDLNNASQFAGLTNIFNWNKDWELVDFNKLLPETVLKVSKIIQKTYFNFTQNGTEAAAATAMLICVSGCMMGGFIAPPRIKYIRADNPFIYVLANKNKKNEPLFMGVINNVSELNEK